MSSNSSIALKFYIDISGIEIVLPLTNAVSFTTNWDNGTTNTNILSHTYASPGIYNVVLHPIEGNNVRFGSSTNNSNYQKYLSACTSLYDGITQLNGAFNGCSNLTTGPALLPSSVTQINGMFQDCTKFNSDTSLWNMSSVTDITSLFMNAYAFQGTGISKWYTSSIQITNNAFASISSPTDYVTALVNRNYPLATAILNNTNRNVNFRADVSKWNVDNLTGALNMFTNCANFDSDMSRWNTSNLIATSYMFANAGSFEGTGLSNWCISSMGKIPSNPAEYTTPVGMLNNTGISMTTYNGILNGWASQGPNIQQNVILGAENLYYDSVGLTGRNTLSTIYNWNITGDIFTSGTQLIQNSDLLAWKTKYSSQIQSLGNSYIITPSINSFTEIVNDLIPNSSVYPINTERTLRNLNESIYIGTNYCSDLIVLTLKQIPGLAKDNGCTLDPTQTGFFVTEINVSL